ncbi:MAG: haloacid dehalogenase type II [Actinobacteria bacterium]|nr:haloacid dehalogenase type II [Actinomycetota bacterium]
MKTIVFDVNETLLDLRAMQPRFDAAFGSTDLLAPWFGQLLRHSFVATLTDTYAPFDVLGVDALQLVAAKVGIDLSKDGAAHVVDGMRHLPPHQDVRPAITRLRDHGFRIATLTNSPPHLLTDQLANAEITDLFDMPMSIDPVRKFKPHPDTYQSGAKRLGVDINEMRLVAAHDWDVTGAIRAGAAAAFVARPGMVLSRASETPDIVGPDLETVTAAIIDIDG